MNKISKILNSIAKKSNGKMRIKKVPREKRLTGEGVARLEREIAAQIDVNDVMRYKSYINANKRV